MLRDTEEAKEVMLPVKDNHLTILSEELVEKFISDVSEMKIDEVVKAIRDKPKEWTTFRPLKFL